MFKIMSNLKGYLKDKSGNKIYPDEYDTGWIDLSPLLQNGFVVHEDAYLPSYRKVGNQVFLRGLLVNHTKDSSYNEEICQMPITPTSQVFFAVASQLGEDNNSNKVVQLSINASGSVILFGTALPQHTWFALDGISYFID